MALEDWLPYLSYAKCVIVLACPFFALLRQHLVSCPTIYISCASDCSDGCASCTSSTCLECKENYVMNPGTSTCSSKYLDPRPHNNPVHAHRSFNRLQCYLLAMTVRVCCTYTHLFKAEILSSHWPLRVSKFLLQVVFCKEWYTASLTKPWQYHFYIHLRKVHIVGTCEMHNSK